MCCSISTFSFFNQLQCCPSKAWSSLILSSISMLNVMSFKELRSYINFCICLSCKYDGPNSWGFEMLKNRINGRIGNNGRSTHFTLSFCLWSKKHQIFDWVRHYKWSSMLMRAFFVIFHANLVSIFLWLRVLWAWWVFFVCT